MKKIILFSILSIFQIFNLNSSNLFNFNYSKIVKNIKYNFSKEKKAETLEKIAKANLILWLSSYYGEFIFNAISNSIDCFNIKNIYLKDKEKFKKATAVYEEYYKESICNIDKKSDYEWTCALLAARDAGIKFQKENLKSLISNLPILIYAGITGLFSYKYNQEKINNKKYSYVYYNLYNQ